MKYFLFSFCCVFSIKANAQKVNAVKDPVINPVLAVQDNPRLASDVYLVNDNTIIFQENRTIRKVIKADTKSFSVSQRSDPGFMAKNKEGIFVKGNFVKTDTLGYQYIGFSNDGPFWRTQKVIYKNTTELKHLKASEFIPLKDSQGNYSHNGYYQFNNKVYYYDKVTPIDIHTVVLLENEQCYDEKGIYERGEKLLFEGEPLQYLSPHFHKMKNTLVKSGSFK
ncbi:hypothetical protein [Chryseobacterium sp. T20]|uniref:hypothetical protein n=1 Tax=Chryseobacterium sp. T20 TaxID=3395375 RepID=UPI0039BD4599